MLIDEAREENRHNPASAFGRVLHRRQSDMISLHRLCWGPTMLFFVMAQTYYTHEGVFNLTAPNTNLSVATLTGVTCLFTAAAERQLQRNLNAFRWIKTLFANSGLAHVLQHLECLKKTDKKIVLKNRF